MFLTKIDETEYMGKKIPIEKKHSEPLKSILALVSNNFLLLRCYRLKILDTKHRVSDKSGILFCRFIDRYD